MQTVILFIKKNAMFVAIMNNDIDEDYDKEIEFLPQILIF